MASVGNAGLRTALHVIGFRQRICVFKWRLLTQFGVSRDDYTERTRGARMRPDRGPAPAD